MSLPKLVFTYLRFAPLQHFMYVQNAPRVKVRQTEVKLLKCTASLHECSVEGDQIKLGRNVDQWVVQGLEGEFSNDGRVIDWGKIILGWIPENQRESNYLSFLFSFHFADGSVQQTQSRYVYVLEKVQLTPQEMKTLKEHMKYRSARGKTQLCGIQSPIFKKTKTSGR